MLGRTNITTVKGGTIVSDISDYVWNDAGTLNINSSFKKAFYANNILVAITKGGFVIYTRDGENWEEASPNIDVEYKIFDGIWDGHKFVFVGHHSTDQEDVCQALIVTTEDFQNYEIMRDCQNSTYYSSSFYAIFLREDATYTIIYAFVGNQALSNPETRVYFLKGDLTNLSLGDLLVGCGNTGGGKRQLNSVEVEIAECTDCFIFYIKARDQYSASNISYVHKIGIADRGDGNIQLKEEKTATSADIVKVFECKDSLYYMTLEGETSRLVRKKNFSNENETVVSDNKNWGFVDAVYFNRCEIFITDHQMLVVKPGENIADKTESDLVDISYDISLRTIIKAFEKLYIFGTDGTILVSSDEIKNENAVAVKTMTAVKALYEAKGYTDEKYAELEERVSKLEELKNNSTEV